MNCEICDDRFHAHLLKGWDRLDGRRVCICEVCGAAIAEAFGFVRPDSTIVPPVDPHRPNTEPAALSELVPIVMRDLEQVVKRAYALDTARTALVQELGLLIESDSPSGLHMAKHLAANAIVEVARQVAIVVCREHIDHPMQTVAVADPTSTSDPPEVVRAEMAARRACE
jgi:hypothetical protein